MVNPAAIMKLMGAKNKFESAHPKFTSFITMLYRQGISEGTVIEVTVTKPDGTALTGNMRVQQSDLEILGDLKNLSANS